MLSEAFVTLVTNDGYALGALVLAQSIRQVGTKRNLVVLISKHLSDSQKGKINVKDVELIIDELNMIPINKVGVSFLDVMENKNVLGKLYYYLNNSRVSLAIKLFFLEDKLIFLNYPF